MFDVDGSGKISADELKQILGSKNIDNFFLLNWKRQWDDQKHRPEILGRDDKGGR